VKGTKQTDDLFPTLRKVEEVSVGRGSNDGCWVWAAVGLDGGFWVLFFSVS